MSDTVQKYAAVLHSMNIDYSSIKECRKTLAENDELNTLLSDPRVSADEKEKVLARIFSSKTAYFIKIVLKNGCFDQLENIFDEYEDLYHSDGCVYADVYCIVPPDDKQAEQIKKFLCKKFDAPKAELNYIKDESLIGGFIIKCGDVEFDRSLKGRFAELEHKLIDETTEIPAMASDDIISIIRDEIVNYDFENNDEEVGTVISVGDGIANIYGMNHAMYGEIVVFECGIKGMVQDIRRNQIGCILFGSETEISEGTKVTRTHKKAGVPVGDAFIGRIINALGEPLDGKGSIKADDYRPVEQPAPSIVERKSVDTPLATGILAIDSMFPIGRGQRELIIGDRQTGKTAIAVDTILNQKGKDVICIYNAVGQKASTVTKLVSTLKKHNAMDYTIVVCSTASDPASLQYIAPYSATSMAEYFMHKGKDVLIVYDDLSKHAVAYRALSLLLERSPGREAYPGDVFYLHSRLLERSSRLSDELGGGSITALPIIETQAGDVSAYIPTNVISITDGQIFLESDLFFSGIRPAVNVGLSVSRVGGAAQTKAMKKAAGSLRVDLAQYREMEVFTQFSSDLDEETKSQLNYGATLIELLKQDLCHPLSLSDMVISLVAATNKKMVNVSVDEIKKFQFGLLEYIGNVHSEISDEIENKKVLSDEMKDAILSAADEYKKVYNG